MISIIAKILTTILLFTLFTIEVYATTAIDKGDTIPTMDREYYLQKSKAQRTGAIVMVSVGTAAFGIGLWGSVISTFKNAVYFFSDDNNGASLAYGVVAIIGGVLALGSIPLFRAAHINRRMAKSMPVVHLKMENIISRKMPGINKPLYPAIALQFNF